MARQALTIIGGVVGAFFGNPQLGLAIGSVVGGLVDPEVIKAPSVRDVAQQTAQEGVPCPLYDGTVGGSGNMVYCAEPTFVTVRERQGKGGPVVESERVILPVIVIRVGAALQDGPGVRNGIPNLIKVWEDDKLVYDVSPTSQILEESAEYANGFAYYPGNETQLPDPDLEAILGATNAVAYRGRAVFIRKNYDATDRRGTPPNFKFEVATEASETSAVSLFTDVRYYSGAPDELAVASADIGFASTINYVRISPNGQYAVGIRLGSSVSGKLKFLRYSAETDSWNFLADPADIPTFFIASACFISDNRVAIGFDPTNGGDSMVWTYEFSGDTVTRLTPPSTVNPNSPTTYGLALNREGNLLAVGNNNSGDNLYVFDYLDGDLSNARKTASDIEGSASRIAFNSTSTRVATGSVKSSGTNYLKVYEVGASSLTRLARGTTIRCSEGVYWHTDDEHIIAVGTNLVGDKVVVSVVHWDEETDTLSLVSSITLSGSISATDSSMTADGAYLAIAVGEQAPRIVSVSAASPPVLTELEPPGDSGVAIASVSWGADGSTGTIEAGATSFNAVTLAAGRRCGMADSDFDLSEMDGISIRGVVVGSQNYTGQDLINGLRVAFPSDGSCFDGKINILLRGGAVDFELDDEFRVEEGNDGEQDEVLRNGDDQRKAPLRRPAKTNLMFPNANLGYTLTKASAPNYGAPEGVVAEVTLEVPVVLDEETEAPQLADILDKISRAEQDGEVVRVFPEYLAAKAVPGTIIRLTEGGLQRRLAVRGIRTAEGARRLSLWADRQHAYTSNASAPSSAGWPTPPPSLPGETVAAFFNLPALVDENDSLGVYVAISGQPGTAWRGARIEYRVQGFTAWNDLGTYTQRAVMGTLLSDFPAGSEFYPDTTNPLEVSLLQDDQIETLSYEEWLAEQGAWAIRRDDGTAEIIQPRYAQDDSNQDWTLTTHQRGRLATSTAAHSAGARIVQLDGCIFLPLPSSAIGKTLEFRVTALGGSPETAPIHTLTWSPAVVQREFPVAYLSLSRGGGTIAGEWIERRRFGTDVNPIRSANWEGFRVTLTDGTTTETFDTTDTSFSRSDSAFSGPITVTVQQLNRYTGAGPGTSEIA